MLKPFNFLVKLPLLMSDDSLNFIMQARKNCPPGVIQFLCNRTQGLCHLGPAEEGDFYIRDSVFLFHCARNINKCATAYDNVQFGPVRMGYLFKGCIACDPRHYPYPGGLKHRLDKP